MATHFSEIVHSLTGFLTHLTEPEYYFSVLRYVSSNNMLYFSPHALFSQAARIMFWQQGKVLGSIYFMRDKVVGFPKSYHKY